MKGASRFSSWPRPPTLACPGAGGPSNLACPLCARAVATDAPHWSYEGATGPEHWGDLEPDFHTCEIGTQQSPIEIAGAVKASLRPVGINYQKVPLRVWNNGHYLQINVPPGNQLNLARGRRRPGFLAP